METIMAILMLIGVFVGVPVLIGFTIVGIYAWSDRQVRREYRVQEAEVVAEVQSGQPSES